MRPRHRGTGRTRSLVHRDAAHRHRRAAPHRRCARAPRVETREERLGGQTMVEQDMTMQGRHWHNGNCPSTMPTRRANHGARHTTAHFPSRPKNHTAFLGLYGKMRRHPPCAVVFLPRVSIFPIEKNLPRYPSRLSVAVAYGKNCLGPARTLCRLPDCRIESAIIRLLKINTGPAHTCLPTFGSQGSQATLPDDCGARVTS